MKRYWVLDKQILAVVGVLLLCGNAIAQDEETAATTTEQLSQTQKEIQVELAGIKSELQAIRRDLAKVLSELKAVRAGQGKGKAKGGPDTTVYKIEIGDSPIRGPKNAPVTIVEYASFACGYCIKEDPVIRKVMAAYPNDVRFVFKHYPLWPKAEPAHAATAMALAQKGAEDFWKMHDLIVAGGTRKLDTPTLRKYAETLGMDLNEFDAVMGDPTKVKALVSKDAPGAKKCKVRGTPSVFINGLRLSSRGFDNYKARIDDILKKGAIQKQKPKSKDGV